MNFKVGDVVKICLPADQLFEPWAVYNGQVTKVVGYADEGYNLEVDDQLYDWVDTDIKLVKKSPATGVKEKKRYVISSRQFKTLDEAKKAIKDYFKSGSLDKKAKIFEITSDPVEWRVVSGLQFSDEL